MYRITVFLFLEKKNKIGFRFFLNTKSTIQGFLVKNYLKKFKKRLKEQKKLQLIG